MKDSDKEKLIEEINKLKDYGHHEAVAVMKSNGFNHCRYRIIALINSL